MRSQSENDSPEDIQLAFRQFDRDQVGEIGFDDLKVGGRIEAGLWRGLQLIVSVKCMCPGGRPGPGGGTH